MMNETNTMDAGVEERDDELLRKLMHLKRYERPSVDRMTKSRNNITRRVREVNSRKRWSLSDVIEMNIPWFFAEPRYGIALLFIVFAGLQFLGLNAQKRTHAKTGIYTSNDPALAAYAQSPATNSTAYPKLPGNLKLFPEQQNESGVKFVGRLEESR